MSVLPENIAATYEARNDGDVLHMEHHDVVHELYNRLKPGISDLPEFIVPVSADAMITMQVEHQYESESYWYWWWAAPGAVQYIEWTPVRSGSLVIPIPEIPVGAEAFDVFLFEGTVADESVPDRTVGDGEQMASPLGEAFNAENQNYFTSPFASEPVTVTAGTTYTLIFAEYKESEPLAWGHQFDLSNLWRALQHLGNTPVVVALDDPVSGSLGVALTPESTASGFTSFAVNEGAVASGDFSSAFNAASATGGWSHAEGTSTASGERSHAEGSFSTASGLGSHAEGDRTLSTGDDSHSEGSSTQATNNGSHAEGIFSVSSGQAAHAEGLLTTASGDSSHAEGTFNTALGSYSHAEGYSCQSNASASHAEGSQTIASGTSAHAEGAQSQASGVASHAEGWNTVASVQSAHAEGYVTQATGFYSHAEGFNSVASGTASHAEGYYGVARFLGSHASAGGFFSVAGDAQYLRIVRHKSGNGNMLLSSDTLLDGRVYTVSALIVMSGSSGANVKGMEVGLVVSTVGTDRIVGSVTNTVLAQDAGASAYDVIFGINNTTHALTCTVSGTPSKTVGVFNIVESVI